MSRWTIVCISLLLAHGQLRAVEEPGFRELGEALVASLRDADAVSYAQCWSGIRATERLMATPPPGVPPLTAEERAEYRTYTLQRNEVVSRSFTVILDELARRGIARSSLVLKSIGSGAPPREQHGMRSVSRFAIVIGSDHGDLEYRIDDGALIEGAWYFTDKPTNLKIGAAWLSFREKPAAGMPAAPPGPDGAVP